MQKHQNGKQRNASRTKHKAKANTLKDSLLRQIYIICYATTAFERNIKKEA